MPVSADTERRLLNHYKLTSLYPTEWPHQNDSGASSGSDDEDDPAYASSKSAALNVRPKSSASRDSRSKFRNIDRHASIRSSLSGTQKTQAGVDSLVQKDEPDPLGMAPSVATILRGRGLPVEENLKFRNRFMLSSTSFSPQLFLSQVHQNASTEDLLRGLDFLSRSIEQKSASLKVLVESNFERFVKAKATIDNVYTEMRTQGIDPEPERPQSARVSHSRHTSRTSQGHFRNTSGAFGTANKPLPSDMKKNALTKESEYGVQGIKAPLNEVAVKAEEVWGPALSGREKEDMLKSVLSTLEQHREVFKLSTSLQEATKKNDYDTVVEDYKRAKKHAAEAREVASTAQARGTELSELEIQRIIVTARMWHAVSGQVDVFKRDLWKRLKDSHAQRRAISQNGAIADGSQDKDLHMELIGVLLQLGVDENPIYEYLLSRFFYLKDRIARTSERSNIETEILRRRLVTNELTDSKALAKHLRWAMQTNGSFKVFQQDKYKDMDLPSILAFWKKVQASLTELISPQTGILSEVIDFWDTVMSFINHKAQKSFPTAVFAAGLEHLELEPAHISELENGAIELVNLLRECVQNFFTEPPVDDLSDLYSPIPPTPITPRSANGDTTPSIKRTFTFDPNNVPPLSPKTGSAWEKFAFWPPGANALSGSHFLSQFLVLVGTAASEMAGLTVIKQQGSRSNETFKMLVGAVRERSVQAVCAAWNQDAERVKLLEDWVRSNDRKDLTNMPLHFNAFEDRVLANMQKISYISEASTLAERGGTEVGTIVTPPPAKLLQAIRGIFVTSLYKALSGMVENAEKVVTDRQVDEDVSNLTNAIRGMLGDESVNGVVDANNRNVRMLMTLSNIAHLRSETIPQLITQFESSFSVKLTEESKTIRDVLGQIDARLFQSYVKPTVDRLVKIITEGVTSRQWSPEPSSRPNDARPYVYDVLLTLVMVHSEVSTTTTSTTMTGQILSYLLDQCSLAHLNAFKQRQHYTLEALMQATLDVEFMAQTLNSFTTDRAGEVQSSIYLALDERTDNEARSKLQGELPEMRAVLKRLREGTKGEFGCFKKERRGRTTNPVGV
ncbi:exocyst complex protein, partial [Polychaeton citri CBS 116435]